MREEDIFGITTGQAYISEIGQRICISLSDKCRLYKYDKRIGTYIDVYFDHIDKEQLKKEMRWRSYNEIYGTPFNKLLMYLEIEAYNFDEDKYEAIQPKNTSYFEVENKNTKQLKILLKACHLDDNGSVKFKIKYLFKEHLSISTGFLGRKIEFYSDTYESKETIILENKLLQEANGNNEIDEDNWGFF